MKLKLLIATHNPGKVAEIGALLNGLPLEYFSLNDVGILQEIAETGDTYAANALLKAVFARRAAGLTALADDSGLEVDVLGGRPGLHTARYAGPDATHTDRWAKLLDELRGIPWEKRTARFRCTVALAAPGREPLTVEGTCEGLIAFEPSGSGGFGYDPLFFIAEHNCTMAELSEEVKNRISHRARAMQKARAVLLEWLKTEHG